MLRCINQPHFPYNTPSFHFKHAPFQLCILLACRLNIIFLGPLAWLGLLNPYSIRPTYRRIGAWKAVRKVPRTSSIASSVKAGFNNMFYFFLHVLFFLHNMFHFLRCSIFFKMISFLNMFYFLDVLFIFKMFYFVCAYISGCSKLWSKRASGKRIERARAPSGHRA